MGYNFFPDSYNYSFVDNIGKSEFLKLQIKYKNSFEKFLMKIINFEEVDNYISSFGIEIPIVMDLEYNFYHKFSLLNSKYIYFRNNIHIENLSMMEIDVIRACLIDNRELDLNFLLSTYERVIFETGDFSLFGTSKKENIVKSKSLVFEFAYDQKKFSSIAQYDLVKKLLVVLFQSFKDSIKKYIDIEISMFKYNAIPDIYLISKDNVKK